MRAKPARCWRRALRWVIEDGESATGRFVVGRSAPRPQVVLDLFHVGNPRRPVTFDQVHYTAIDETGNQTGANVNYGKVTQDQPPMSARLGLVVAF